jgi:predicted nucleic acid-binding protein
MNEPAAVDTNVLVYRYDPSDPVKQSRATELLRRGAAEGSLVVPYQAVVEFVAATTRPRARGRPPLLTQRDAWREARELSDVFEVLYPDAETVPTAVSLAAVHGLAWFDALLLAYAERRAVTTLWSEDFEAGRRYGRVRTQNPFAATDRG